MSVAAVVRVGASRHRGLLARSEEAKRDASTLARLERRTAERRTPQACLRSGGVLLSGVIPVDHVPERFHVFRPTILVFEIVGVFPDVDADDRNFFVVRFRDRTVLIGRRA